MSWRRRVYPSEIRGRQTSPPKVSQRGKSERARQRRRNPQPQHLASPTPQSRTLLLASPEAPGTPTHTHTHAHAQPRGDVSGALLCLGGLVRQPARQGALTDSVCVPTAPHHRPVFSEVQAFPRPPSGRRVSPCDPAGPRGPLCHQAACWGCLREHGQGVPQDPAAELGGQQVHHLSSLHALEGSARSCAQSRSRVPLPGARQPWVPSHQTPHRCTGHSGQGQGLC